MNILNQKKVVNLSLVNVKKHVVITLVSFGLAIVLGAVDYQTHSASDLFLNRGNLVALIIYTLLFMAVSYTGVWLWQLAKSALKNV